MQRAYKQRNASAAPGGKAQLELLEPNAAAVCVLGHLTRMCELNLVGDRVAQGEGRAGGCWTPWDHNPPEMREYNDVTLIQSQSASGSFEMETAGRGEWPEAESWAQNGGSRRAVPSRVTPVLPVFLNLRTQWRV